MKRRIIVMGLAIILALGLAAPIAYAQTQHKHHQQNNVSQSTGSQDNQNQGNQNPGVIPPQADNKYASLSEKWWQWAFSIPKDRNPLVNQTDNTGEQCKEGQSGNVWFLGAQVGDANSLPSGFNVDRHCNVPTGKQLFFPLINVECSTIEPQPQNGTTYEEHSKCAKDIVNAALAPNNGQSAILSASVDGVPIKNLDPKNTPYHVASGPPSFSYTLPSNSINTFCGPDADHATQQCGPATTDAAADGVYVLLTPLPPGQHIITFGGQFFPNGPGDFGFTMRVRYTINVVKGKEGS